MAATKATAKPTDPLRAIRQKVQVLRRQVSTLAHDDDVWRDFLALQAGGERSTRAMTERQLEAVVKALFAAGAPRPVRSRYAAAPQHAKARAIWIALFEAGVVSNRSDKALDAFIERQTGQEIGSLSAKGWYAVIEALKQWAARKGVELAP